VIYLIKNILTDNEREKLIKDCKPYLLDGKELSEKYGGSNYPGKQTEANLHSISCFKDPINKILFKSINVLKKDLGIQKAWINWTSGKPTDIGWHNHPNAKFSAVYYLTPHNCGTQFEDSFVETELNSLLIFSSDLLHTAPISNERYDRYTMALDLNYQG
tara:strand:+ start:73 stop:552 length:480 start_codon:yes stop_codon:yes gene_type:complete